MDILSARSFAFIAICQLEFADVIHVFKVVNKKALKWGRWGFIDLYMYAKCNQ